jgi:hypothetical protein
VGVIEVQIGSRQETDLNAYFLKARLVRAFCFNWP